MKKSQLVDFHCHLDLYKNYNSLINEIDRAEVRTLAVTTTPRAWPHNYELTKETKYVRAALGLHPQLISEISYEIKLWEKYLPQTRYIGEVGLDGSRNFSQSLNLQKDIFIRILDACREHGNKILTVHSVRAVNEILPLIEKHLPQDKGVTVLHWFTGSLKELKVAIDLGCYFSINSAMLHTQRGRSIIEHLPQNRILTETDGPFTYVGERPALPTDISALVKNLAELKSVTYDKQALNIQENLKNLLLLNQQ